jgi:hypothetical protein
MDDPLPRRPRRSRRGSRAADTAAQCNASACNVPSRWRPCRWPPHEATRTVALLSASLGAPAASPKQCRSRSTCALRRTARRTGPRPCGKRRCAAGRGERALDPAAGSHVPDAATSTRARCPRWHVLSGARRRATGPGAHRASCGCRAARAAIARTAALHRGAARAPPPAAERRAASESASTAFSHARCPPRHGAVRASAARNGAQRARARDARGNGSSGSSRALPPE